MSALLAWTALLWAVLAGGLGGIALVRRLAQRRRAETLLALPAPGPAVLLMRPCAGAEPTLAQCLHSITAARRSVPVEVVVGVSAAEDSAAPIAERCCADLQAAGIPARLEVHPPRGPNRKAAILAGICERHDERFDIVINADSNIDLAGYDLDALVAPLRRDLQLGATWAPPVEQGLSDGLGDRSALAVLGGSLHAFPLLAGIDPAGLVGKLFAVRSDALRAVGGFAAYTEVLGEDTELSRRLRAHGLGVLPLPEPVRSYARRERFADTVARQARWMAVIRAQRLPLLFTYPLFFCGTPIILLLAALGLWSAPLVATLAALIAVAGRVFVSLAAQGLSLRRPQLGAALVDALLGDAALLAAFARALTTTRLEWRGHRLRITRGGRLIAEP